MSGNLAPVLRQYYYDSNGNPLSGGQLFSYQAGTTTPQATYTDATLGTPNANPVILDASGGANVWLDPTLSYKFVLKDSNSNQLWSVDNVIGVLTANSVSTNALQDGSVTNAKLGSGAVSASKLGLTTSSKTSNYTLTATDSTILADASGGSFTLTLPTATTCAGRIYIFKRIDSVLANSVTLAPNGVETIDLSSSLKLMTLWESVMLLSNGTYWNVIAHKCDTSWTSYTPTFGGFGTVSNVAAFWRRSGDSIEIKAKFTSGTLTPANATISLPSGVTIDSARMGTGLEIFGVMDGNDFLTNQLTKYIVAQASGTSVAVTRRYSGASDTPLTLETANNILLSSTDYSFSPVKLPIQNWWA